MAEIRRYVLVGRDDVEHDKDYDRADLAIDEAKRLGETAVLCRIYSYEDTELVWAPDGGETWPPDGGRP